MKKASLEHNLQVLNPHLSREWHPTKNGALTPENVLTGSDKKVWWLCKTGHEWETAIKNRTGGTGCPYCAGQAVCLDNCLATVNPQLSEEWHPTMNDGLKSQDVIAGTARKVWWLCKKGHEWEANVNSRSSLGTGCPYCSNQKVSKDSCLQTKKPSIALEWHPSKNGILTPNDVTAGTSRKVWWICKKGHEWQASVNSRYTMNRGCPFCSNQLVGENNSLLACNPNLAKEWHTTKNGERTPKKVIAGSGKKAWWICRRGHEWQATISSRSSLGTGCPYCGSQTSKIELRIYTELKFLIQNIEHRKKLFGVECDIYLTDFKIAIEVDGVYWHKNKNLKDQFKNDTLRKEGIVVLRIREKGLPKVSDDDIICSSNKIDFDLMRRVVSFLQEHIQNDRKLEERFAAYLSKETFANQNAFEKLLYMLPGPLPVNSLAEQNKNLALDWHTKKNNTLTPYDVAPFSEIMAWWLCKNGHEWQASIHNRSQGNGCPYCAGQRVTLENNLGTLRPDLVGFWHPTKNNSMTPFEVLPKSNFKVWWVCAKGHEWEAKIADLQRKGAGCPYCSGRRVNQDNCLAAVNSALAKEWHPTKNGELTPINVTPGSKKKVWWLGKCGHEWEAVVYSRNSGRGCPYCAGNRKKVK